MTYALWIVQALLAALFLFAGGMKLVLPLEQMTGPIALPGPLLRFIGVMEVLGGLGLVLPGLLGIRPGLTPLAAAGLVIAGFWWIVIDSGFEVCEPAPLLAVIANVYAVARPVLAAGVPVILAVPLRRSVKTSPFGSCGLIVSLVAVGTPGVDVMTNGATAAPTVNVGSAGTLSTGNWKVESFKICVNAPLPSLAVIETVASTCS